MGLRISLKQKHRAELSICNLTPGLGAVDPILLIAAASVKAAGRWVGLRAAVRLEPAWAAPSTFVSKAGKGRGHFGGGKGSFGEEKEWHTPSK